MKSIQEWYDEDAIKYIRADDLTLESCHDWVQYAFPTYRRSQFQPQVPIMTEEDVRRFKYDTRTIATSTLLISRFMYFLQPCQWITPFNHNFLRVTRLLTHLNIIGAYDTAQELFEWLSELREQEEYSTIITAETFRFWTEAYNDN